MFAVKCERCGKKARQSWSVQIWEAVGGTALVIVVPYLIFVALQDERKAYAIAAAYGLLVLLPAWVAPLRRVDPDTREHWQTTLRRWFRN
jgi:hypothetical protein